MRTQKKKKKSQSCFVSEHFIKKSTNIALFHRDLTSFQYYKGTHKNDYQKETLRE